MPEKYNNYVETTLTAAIASAGALNVAVTSATGFPSTPEYRIRIDDELIIVTSGAGTLTWGVVRGAESTTAATHANGARVYHVLSAGSLVNLPVAITRAGAGDDAFTARQTSDSANMFGITVSGIHNWGPGGATAPDTNLYRSAANTLKTDDAFTAAGVITATGGYADRPAITSTTSLTVGTGIKTFTVTVDSSGSSWKTGQLVRAYGSTASNFIEGNITSYSGTSLTISGEVIGGTGTLASWTLERAYSRIIAYTTTGANTWTRPAGLSHIIVECQGGGGQGGGTAATAAGTGSTGGGGGGGGYARKLLTAAALTSGGIAVGGTCTATVGTGGSSGAAGADGQAGGNSTFAGGTLTTVQGSGGTGGLSAATSSSTGIFGVGSAGGSASGGDVNITGGGGGSGGVSGGVPINNGYGGTSVLGGITKGLSGTNQSAQAGVGYGGGGSGPTTYNTGGASRAGGAGAQGIVIVTEYYTD